MRRGRPKRLLLLTPEERATLERWARRPKSAQALAPRARIVRVCAQGKSNTAVAAELGGGAHPVGKWRARFVARRLDGLLDEPRPGAPRQITDTQGARVITWTRESTPGKATHGSTRLLARRGGMR
jgi:transposase